MMRNDELSVECVEEESSVREKQNALAGIKADERYDDTIWKEPIRIVKIGLNGPAGEAEEVCDYIYIYKD
jgi:hypothetical protein